MKWLTFWALARFAAEGGAGGAGGGEGGGGAEGGAGAGAGGAGGGAQPTGFEWHADLAEDLRGNEIFAREGFKAKDGKEALNKIAASYVSARRMTSEGALPMPKTDKDRAQIYDALGRPKTAGDYTYKPDAKKLEAVGLKFVDGADKPFRELAHKHGVSDAGYSEMQQAYWDGLSGFAAGMAAQRDADFAEAETALKEKWKGPAFDQNVKIAQQAFVKLGGQAFMDFLDQTGLGNVPELLEFAHAAGAATMSEEELKGAHMATGGMTKEAIEAKKAEIKANPAYMDKYHPQHKALVAEMSQLMQYLHPEPEK